MGSQIVITEWLTLSLLENSLNVSYVPSSAIKLGPVPMNNQYNI